MNIVVLAQRLPYPPIKGEKIRTLNQIIHLRKKGHEVSVFFPIESDKDYELIEEFEKQIGVSCYYVKPANKIARFARGILHNESLSVANFYSSRLQEKFVQHIAEQSVQCIICSASSMAKYVFKCRESCDQTTNFPTLIMDFMDVDSDKWSQYAANTSFPMSWIYQRESRLLTALEKNIVEEFDTCFLIAEPEVTLFNKTVCPTNNLFVLGNGLDTSAFYPPTNKVKTSDLVLLFTGVMDYKPNVDAVKWFIDECWEDIKTQFPKAKFVVAGMNPVSELIKLAEKDNGIEVTGFVDDILPYFHSADVFVAPFRLARGVQNKVLQAFACGLPVVSTPMGAEGIECKDQQDVFIANTPKDFVDAIITLSRDAALGLEVGENARTLIEKLYSWEGQLMPLDQALNKESDS